MLRTSYSRWLMVAVFCIVVLIYHETLKPFSSPLDSLRPHSQLAEDTSYLRQLLNQNGIGPRISYASRTVRYRTDAKVRPSITSIGSELFPQPFVELDLEQTTSLPAELKPVQVHVTKSPRPEQIDASALLFGVSTTFGRFNDTVAGPLREWMAWLTDGRGHSNGAGLVLTLYEASEAELGYATDLLDAVGINATVQASNPALDMPGRYVELVSTLYHHPTRPQRKYLGLVDDDTFFPSISALLSKLSTYDPSKPHYIGAFTERLDWIMQHKVPMAYGGGGIFLTPPLARGIAELPCLERDDSGAYLEWGQQGDLLLYNCLHNHTEIALTYIPQLHQLDQWGDASGFYESGQQPLSLHHFKSWHHLLPDRMAMVAHACGEDCILQRFQFADNFIISNGYSVAQYPTGIDFDTAQMEGTFDNGAAHDDIEDVTLSYSFGPLRKKLAGTGRKRAWELLDARREGKGRVRQVYVKRLDDKRWLGEGEELPELDSVAVLLWTT